MKRQNPIQKATRKIEAEGRKHCFRIYSATAMALWRHWGKRTEAISRLFDTTHDVWNECKKSHNHSMIAMCEAETGIEIQNGDGKSWRDLLYLNDDFRNHPLTYEQAVVMRQNQTKWIPAQITASILIAMHRKHGFGYDRCARLYQQMQDIEAEFKFKPDRIKNACIAETGLNVFEEVRAE